MTLRNLKIFIIIGQLLILLLFNFHCLQETTTNHTGLDLSWWVSVSLVFGTVLLLASKFKPNLTGKTDKLIVIIFVISILSALNILIFDHYNIFVEYETWCKRGMPKKPF